MAEILNQTLKGNFFQDVFHGTSENGNYLSHHFAPSILILSPFLLLSETRIGYGYGLIFFVFLTFLGLYLNIKSISRQKKLLISLLFISNLYNYRLFTSYHFEILFLCFSLYWNWGIQRKKIFIEIIFFILMLTLKEDISIYLIIYSLVFLFKKDFIRFIFYLSTCTSYHFIFISYIWNVLDTSTKVNWLESWNVYGNSIQEIFIYLLKNPIVILEKFLIKKNVWIDYFGSFSFLPFLNLYYISSLVLVLFIHLLSNRIWHNTLYHYYSYSLLPFTWIGAMETIQKYRIHSSFIPILVGMSLYFSSLDFHYPLKFLKPHPEIDSISETMQKIPKNTQVQVSHHLGIFLSKENSLFKLQKGSFKDYIVFHPSPFLSYEENHTVLSYLKNAEKKGEISLIFEKNSVKLYRKQKLVDNVNKL